MQVERIRRVGVILLELIQTLDDIALKTRAQSFFRRLLDTLAKLNSKASDDLGGIELQGASPLDEGSEQTMHSTS